MHKFDGRNELPESETSEDPLYVNMGAQGLGELTPEAQEYILHLQSRLSSANSVRLIRWILHSPIDVTPGQIINCFQIC